MLDTTFALFEIVENNIISSISYNDNIINIFPNPTSINEIEIISDICIENIDIIDLYGNIIISNMQIDNHIDNIYFLTLPNIESGTYFIRINKNSIYKLIICK
jgi:hypothetical protein